MEDVDEKENVGYLAASSIATQEQAVANLDKVREIVLDNAARLEMNHWHGSEQWRNRTCAEETLCNTTHCLAGWLQVCSTVPEIRGAKDAQRAGFFSAPIAAGMFFQPGERVLQWLTDREYDNGAEA
jgi:hypothetical protein